jgi:hypothetical protein
MDWSQRSLALHPNDMSTLVSATCLRAQAGQKEQAIDTFERLVENIRFNVSLATLDGSNPFLSIRHPGVGPGGIVNSPHPPFLIAQSCQARVVPLLPFP